MTGFTIPLGAQPSSHPVHRATELLREALHTLPSADPKGGGERWNAPTVRLDPADPRHRPIRLAAPEDSLVTLLGFAPFEYVPLDCQPPVTDTPDLGTTDGDEGEDEQGGMLEQAVQAQLQGLVQAFYRRQRQASLLVACSIAAAVIMTLGGLVLLFGAIDWKSADRERAGAQNETSVARSAPNMAPKAPAAAPIRSASAGKIVTARPEQPLALGPYLPVEAARYVLLRGLPETATLSAGRRTGAGTWMVKREEIGELTLTLNEGVSGDYPTEVYLLDPPHGPQARRRFVLRVDASPQIFAAGLALGWPTVFLPRGSETAETQLGDATASTQPATHRVPAQRLLADGDIVAARRLLIERAEQGHSDAAYRLGLTYDVEILDRAGFEDVKGDMQTAQTWYLQAARAGHAGAVQRLEAITRRHAGV